ncbi:MAG TPA: ATP-binding protein [Thermoguttaceae bacterium]|nr:ATP-binding protein [Thermoguttaceae bacterium]
MNGPKLHNLISSAALVLSAALVIATAGGLVSGFGAWPVRTGLLAGGLALTGGLAALLHYRCRRDRQAVERQLEALCRLDPHDLRNDGTSINVPPLPEGNPWSEVAALVRETLSERCRRLEELEHARAVADIRYRRASTECERIRTILSELSEPILAVDDYDELVLANRSAEELFHFDGGGVESRALAQLVHCEKLVNLLSAASHRKTPGDRTDEIDIPDEKGNSRWFRVTATKPTAAEETDSTEANAHGSVSGGAVAVLRDIGDQKALQKRNAEFVSAVSHEMKSPLAGIKAYVELLADGDAEDEETREEFLDVISGQADRLQRLVENLLNIARIEAGVVNVSKLTRSLNELLEEALNVVQPSAEAKQIELVSELSPMYLGVLADRDMLLQAAINLLSNAIKYTPEKGRVTLRSRLENKVVRFEVQDTGVGLSEEDAQRVFEKFYRVQKDKNMAAGTGLGLPLAKHIVEDVHGGHLTVESKLGEGSTFSVTLPGAGQLT